MRQNMEYARTSHPFDMNEYFSGQRFAIGGRDYEKEDREEQEMQRMREATPTAEMSQTSTTAGFFRDLR